MIDLMVELKKAAARVAEGTCFQILRKVREREIVSAEMVNNLIDSLAEAGLLEDDALESEEGE